MRFFLYISNAMSVEHESKYHHHKHGDYHPRSFKPHTGKRKSEFKSSWERLTKRGKGMSGKPRKFVKRSMSVPRKATASRRKAFVSSSRQRSRSFVSARRKSYKGGSGGSVNSAGYGGTGHANMEIKPFGFKPKNAGVKILRVYETQVNLSNTGAASTAFGYGLRVVNTAGVYTLEVWVGTPGTGTLLATFPDFTIEMASYVSSFRWMKAKKIMFEFIPISNTVQMDDDNTVDMTFESDPGIVRIAPWDGDQTVVTPATGIVQVDWTEFSRNKNKLFRPVGTKSVKYAKIPQQYLAIANAAGPNNGPTMWTYPACYAWDHSQAIVAGASYPMYGMQYYWQHPNLATNSAKVKFTMKIRVEIQWNTLYDEDIALAKLEKKNNEVDARTQAAIDAGLIKPPPGWYDTDDDDAMTDSVTELKELKKMYPDPTGPPRQSTKETPGSGPLNMQTLSASLPVPPMVRGRSPVRALPFK